MLLIFTTNSSQESLRKLATKGILFLEFHLCNQLVFVQFKAISPKNLNSIEQ